MLSERNKIVKVLQPSADGFNTDPAGDVISLANAEEITFLVAHKGGTTGKGRLQVQAVSDVSANNPEFIDFKYRRMTTGDSDTIGAISNAVAADGIETVPTEDTIIEIYVRAAQLPEGKPFVRLKTTETANDPVLVTAIGILSGLRYQGADQPTAIA